MDPIEAVGDHFLAAGTGWFDYQAFRSNKQRQPQRQVQASPWKREWPLCSWQVTSLAGFASRADALLQSAAAKYQAWYIMSRIRHFKFSSNFLFLFCLGPVHNDSFHASVSRKLKQNIVVADPVKPRKFRPRLPKPSTKLLAADMSPVAAFSRKMPKRGSPNFHCRANQSSQKRTPRIHAW